MRIVSVVGARPNFVKIGPLIREMRQHAVITPVLVHTGQHYDEAMSQQFFAELDIPAADHNLEVGSGSHAIQTAEVMRRLEPLLISARPDVVLVVGDVNSTLGAALTAVKLGISVVHVEAGLRSFDRAMPEEINRVLTDAISDLLFITEVGARRNLIREGIAPRKIHFVGNVMADALLASRPRWRTSSIVDRLGLAGTPFAVLTLHRPANVDDPRVFGDLLGALREIGRHIPIVFPVHPRVTSRLASEATAPGSGRGLICRPPLGYLDFVALMSRARLVLTDSGGIQEETTMLGVPCLTLRDTTERPVTVTHGTNRVIGTCAKTIVSEALHTLEHPPRPVAPPPLWDGGAARRIVQLLLAERLARRARAPESMAPAPALSGSGA